jgi:hypothetical protein
VAQLSREASVLFSSAVVRADVEAGLPPLAVTARQASPHITYKFIGYDVLQPAELVQCSRSDLLL